MARLVFSAITGAGAGIKKPKVKSMMMPNLRPHFLRLLRLAIHGLPPLKPFKIKVF